MATRPSNMTPLSGAFPRPSRPLTIVLGALFGLWAMYAVGLNWAGASTDTFFALAGQSSAIAHGEVWRLFTAPWLHYPIGSPGVQSIGFSLMGLYFLGSALEQAWSPKRLVRFLFISAYFSFGLQWLIDLVVPAAVSARLVPTMWFGTTPVIEALAIAFAFSLRDQRILLFFVLPVGSRGLIIATVGISLLLLIADALGTSGLIAPFAGMLAGWLFGGGTPSPARRLWLRWRLRRLDEQSRGGRTSRHRAIHLEILPGGRPASASTDKKKRPLH
jgi:membrane associated rhomboid family serine protease